MPEPLEERRVELCLADLELDVREGEGEVVGRAALDVAGEDVAVRCEQGLFSSRSRRGRRSAAEARTG